MVSAQRPCISVLFLAISSPLSAPRLSAVRLERGHLDPLCLENYVPASAIVAALTWWGQCFRCFRQDTSFSPTMPATISPMLARRNAAAGSPNRMIPSAAVPTAPMPVQTA